MFENLKTGPYPILVHGMKVLVSYMNEVNGVHYFDLQRGRTLAMACVREDRKQPGVAEVVVVPISSLNFKVHGRGVNLYWDAERGTIYSK